MFIFERSSLEIVWKLKIPSKNEESFARNCPSDVDTSKQTYKNITSMYCVLPGSRGYPSLDVYVQTCESSMTLVGTARRS